MPAVARAYSAVVAMCTAPRRRLLTKPVQRWCACERLSNVPPPLLHILPQAAPPSRPDPDACLQHDELEGAYAQHGLDVAPHLVPAEARRPRSAARVGCLHVADSRRSGRGAMHAGVVVRVPWVDSVLENKHGCQDGDGGHLQACGAWPDPLHPLQAARTGGTAPALAAGGAGGWAQAALTDGCRRSWLPWGPPDGTRSASPRCPAAAYRRRWWRRSCRPCRPATLQLGAGAGLAGWLAGRELPQVRRGHRPCGPTGWPPRRGATAARLPPTCEAHHAERVAPRLRRMVVGNHGRHAGDDQGQAQAVDCGGARCMRAGRRSDCVRGKEGGGRLLPRSLGVLCRPAIPHWLSHASPAGLDPSARPCTVSIRL